MARQGAVKAYNNFVKGIITEANALTFPENASLDEANCVLNTDGSRQRRLGMDIDPDAASYFIPAYSLHDAHSAFKWEHVGGDSSAIIGLVQTGAYLCAFDLVANTPINMTASTTYVHVPALASQGYKCKYAAINGDVVITTATSSPILLTRDPTTGYFTYTSITMEMRDFIGLAGEDVDTRPATLSDEHEYNLLNQGWSSANITAYQAYVAGDSVYPSSAQSWYTGKDADDLFDPELLDKFDFGNTPVAKGHFIIDVRGRGGSRRTLTGLGGVYDDTEVGTVQEVTAHAGRMFYAGFSSEVNTPDALSPDYNGWLFFSRTLENNTQLGQCYQEGDPTTEFVGDVIASDGGYVTIPEAARILKLVSMQDALLVIATNGVWQVSGAEGGFLATEYQISKITTVGAIGVGSIVEVEDSLFYWSTGGIYVIQMDTNKGMYVANNVSTSTIQTLYNDIKDISKEYATGVYDAATKKVSWLYNDSDAYGAIVSGGYAYKYNYDTELVLALTEGSFSKNTIGAVDVTEAPYVVGALVGHSTSTREGSYVRYLTNTEDVSGVGTNLTFSCYHESSFHDWKSVDGVGVDAAAYVLTGHELYGNITQIKQVPYFFGYFKRTETGFDATTGELLNPSSCMVQGQWAWTDDASSNRWTTAFQAYRLKGIHMPSSLTDVQPFATVVTKSKLRGKGEALSLLLSSEEDKDFHILGWATSVATLGAP